MVISVVHQEERTIEILKQENRQQQYEITILNGKVKVLSKQTQKRLQKKKKKISITQSYIVGHAIMLSWEMPSKNIFLLILF